MHVYFLRPQILERARIEKRFLLPPRWFADLHTDCDHASGGRSAPLFNDFSLASLSVRLPSEVAVRQVATRNLQPLAAVVFGSAALCIFVVNGHNTAVYLSHLRTNLHYNPRWCPETYSLSEYINNHGFEVNRIISVDLWDAQPGPRARAQEAPAANAGFIAHIQTIWAEGSTGAKRNTAQHFSREHKFCANICRLEGNVSQKHGKIFFAPLAAHPELKSRLAKEFWFGGEKIYELCEVVRSFPVE